MVEYPSLFLCSYDTDLLMPGSKTNAERIIREHTTCQFIRLDRRKRQSSAVGNIPDTHFLIRIESKHAPNNAPGHGRHKIINLYFHFIIINTKPLLFALCDSSRWGIWKSWYCSDSSIG